jgi:hypothetical protein
MTAANAMALTLGATAAISVVDQGDRSFRRLKGGCSEFVSVSFQGRTCYQSQDSNSQ